MWKLVKKFCQQSPIDDNLHRFVPSRLPRAAKPGFTLHCGPLLFFPIAAGGDNSHQTHLHTTFIAC